MGGQASVGSSSKAWLGAEGETSEWNSCAWGRGEACAQGSVLLGTQGRLEHVSLPRARALGAQTQQRETTGEVGRAGRGPFSLAMGGCLEPVRRGPRRCQPGGGFDRASAGMA